MLISIKLYSYINQTLHKAYLGKGNSNLFKRKSTPFPRGDDSNIVNILWCLLNIFSRTEEHNQGIQHFESRGFKLFQINFLNEYRWTQMSMLHCENKKHVDEWNIWHELENKRVIYKNVRKGCQKHQHNKSLKRVTQHPKHTRLYSIVHS